MKVMHDRAHLDIGKELTSLSLVKKRVALAEIVRTKNRIWRGFEITGADKLQVIRIDNDLAGHGAAVRAKAVLAGFLGIPATHAE
jgi:hypothetical protein